MFDPVIIKYQLRDALIYWCLIPAAVIFGGMAADHLLDLPEIPPAPWLMALAFVLLVAGLLLIWRSMKDLADAGGTPNPRRPPRKLVTSGSYSLCRHPMFLGYDLCALSVVLFWRSPGMIFISFPIFIFFEIRFLQKEEKILSLKFKQSFADYQEGTSFLLPWSFIRNFFQRQSYEK